MKIFGTDCAARGAAIAAAIGFVGIAGFQMALAAGAPWGHAAWGGAHAELSTTQRAGSTVAVVVWVAAAAVVLGRAGLWQAGRLAGFLSRGTWFLVALLGFGAALNFASESRWENLLFGPAAVLLAILCLVVARSSRQAGARLAP
jgi:hypothetical protein